MRGVPAWQCPFPARIYGDRSPPHSFQHPSSVSALRADPPSPTRGEGKACHLTTPALACSCRSPQRGAASRCRTTTAFPTSSTPHPMG
ncbi:MAG: hypothetical protein EOQ32_15810 [Mesorhizobium sp.]|nr:hypothetical protein EJ067_05665 [Mesorhizobium sp. M1D.F.Ca.ET.043.01.1.1]RWA91778.1 MAG: hypothetical protein EOQ32_15810 [Mesorhizobium sp.]